MDLNLEYLHSPNPKVKYTFCKELINIGMENPILLYPYFENWVRLLGNSNNIIKWTAIDILGYLTVIDKDNKVISVLPKLIDFLHSGKLITCGHAIFTLGLVAKYSNANKEKIFREFLLVENNVFDTDECRNIAIGKVLDAFLLFITEVNNNTEIIEFIKRATTNSRNATKKKAENFMYKLANQIIIKE